MHSATLRHVPWTCEWGRFGVVESHRTADPRIDDVFWACHHPVIAPHLKVLACGECATCPLWIPTARLSSSVHET